jgi:predicted flap endonuclease-1-like 5' DNA nuclease
MAYPIEKIEGIGPAFGEKLRTAGIKDTVTLLERAATPKGRTALAEATGIAPKLILEFANRADLMRVKGIGEEYSDLLEAAGVDTVPELAQRRPENLLALIEKSDAAKRVRRLPNLADVQAWTEAAKTMPRVLEY